MCRWESLEPKDWVIVEHEGVCYPGEVLCVDKLVWG